MMYGGHRGGGVGGGGGNGPPRGGGGGGGGGGGDPRYHDRAPRVSGEQVVKMMIPVAAAGAIIGKGGQGVKDIMAQTGTLVVVQPLREVPRGGNDREVRVTGTPGNIAAAREIIEQRIEREIGPSGRGRGPPMPQHHHPQHHQQMRGGGGGGGGGGGYGRGRPPMQPQMAPPPQMQHRGGAPMPPQQQHQRQRQQMAPPPQQQQQQQQQQQRGGKAPLQMYKLTLEIPDVLAGCIIGHRGETVRKLDEATGAKIHVGRKEDAYRQRIEGSRSGLVRPITVTGNLEGVTRAQRLIAQELAARAIDVAQRMTLKQAKGARVERMSVPNAATPFMIGDGGQTVREISEDSGAHVKVLSMWEMLPGSVETDVLICGRDADIAAARNMLLARLGQAQRELGPRYFDGKANQLDVLAVPIRPNGSVSGPGVRIVEQPPRRQPQVPPPPQQQQQQPPHGYAQQPPLPQYQQRQPLPPPQQQQQQAPPQQQQQQGYAPPPQQQQQFAPQQQGGAAAVWAPPPQVQSGAPPPQWTQQAGQGGPAPSLPQQQPQYAPPPQSMGQQPPLPQQQQQQQQPPPQGPPAYGAMQPQWAQSPGSATLPQGPHGGAPSAAYDPSQPSLAPPQQRTFLSLFLSPLLFHSHWHSFHINNQPSSQPISRRRLSADDARRSAHDANAKWRRRGCGSNVATVSSAPPHTAHGSA